MKTRAGFVSNSSSSSFIIFSNTDLLGDRCPHCGQTMPDGITAKLDDGYSRTNLSEIRSTKELNIAIADASEEFRKVLLKKKTKYDFCYALTLDDCSDVGSVIRRVPETELISLTEEFWEDGKCVNSSESR